MAVNSAPTFSVGTGKIVTPVGASTDTGSSVVIQADGKIVLAGTANGASDPDFAIVRYNADGSLDTTFGTGGKVITPVGPSSDTGNSAFVQADGKIVLAGTALNGVNGFALVRYNTDGTLDTSFGSGGKVLTAFNSAATGGSAVMQADGRILVAGGASNGSKTEFAIARYNADGTLDTSFGTGGKATVPVGAGSAIGRSVVLEPGGKILIGGDITANAVNGFGAVRLNVDGSLDTSFGTSGKAIAPVDGGLFTAAARQADGSLVLVGQTISGSERDFVLTRLKADGTLDTGFGTNGKAVVSVNSGLEGPNSAAVQADGKIVVAGYTVPSGGTPDFAVLRFNVDGSLDSSFGIGGKVVVPVGDGRDLGYSLALQPDGKIVLGGGTLTGNNNDFAIIRLNADGSLDRGFNGTQTLDATASFTEDGAAVVLDGNVSVYDAELSALNGGQGNFAGAVLSLSREGPASAQDAFTGSGTLKALAESGAVVVGNITIGEVVTNSAGSLVLRFNGQATTALVEAALRQIAYKNLSDTPPDSVRLVWQLSDGNTAGTQGSGGVKTVTGATTVLIAGSNDAPVEQHNGGLTVAEGGRATITAAMLSFTDPEGDGVVYTVTRAADGGTLFKDGLALRAGASFTQADIAAGRISFQHFGGTDESASFSFKPSDTFGKAGAETSFAIAVTAVNDAPTFSVGDGRVLTPVSGGNDSGRSAVVQPDGKIVVGGYGASGSFSDFALVRYNADGSLDATFGSGGKVLTVSDRGSYGHSALLQPDGKIVLGGYMLGSSGLDFLLIRYNTDGSLDTTFNGTGKIVTDVGRVDYDFTIALQPDGKILQGGYTRGGGGTNALKVARYNADGTPDTSFGTNGVASVPFSPQDRLIQSVVVQPDGKIVLGGSVFDSGSSSGDFGLMRLNADGSLDTSFGTDGRVTLPVSAGDDRGFSVVVQPDGKLVLAGGADSHFAAIRTNADGSLDTSFGTGGKVTLTLGSYDRFQSAVLQPDGKLVLAGYSADGSNDDFALVRLNADGSLDRTFGSQGASKVAVGGGNDFGYSVALQPDGKLVLAGTGANGNDDFAVVRLNADGSLDRTFHVANTLGNTVGFTEGEAAVVLDANASIHDAELSALGGGTGNFGGASLTLARDGGARSEDLFGASGTLAALKEGGALAVDGVTVGAVTHNAGGELTLTFNGNATQALLDAVLRQITYANTSDNPPVGVSIAWHFSDGNTGGQGTGGAKSAGGVTTVAIIGVDDPTVFGGDLSPSFAETDAPLAVAGKLTVSDPDGPGNAFEAGVLTGSLGGKLTLQADGTYTYTARSAFNELAAGEKRTDSFTVKAADGAGATVSVEIVGTNDAAVIGGDTSLALTETDAVLTAEGRLTAADPDGAANRFLAATLTGSLGGKMVLRADGTYAYTASSAHDEFSGGQVYADRFTVKAADGTAKTVEILVAGTNDGASISGDTVRQLTETDAVLTAAGRLSVGDVDDPQTFRTGTLKGSLGGALVLQSDGSYVYTASSSNDAFAAGQVHTDSFTVTASDGTEGTVSVQILGTNDAPAAVPLADRVIAEDTAFRFLLPSNSFADPEGGALSFSASLASGAALPSWLVFDADTQTFSGKPPANWNGSLDVKVTAADSAGLSASDTFVLSTTPSNDAPVPPATPGGQGLPGGREDVALTLKAADLLAGFTDPDGDTLSVVGLKASAGTLVANGHGSYTLTPPAEFSGAITLSYAVSDGTAQVAASRTVAIAAVADAPVITSGKGGAKAAYAVKENTAAVARLAASDVDSKTLSWSLSGKDAKLFAISAKGELVFKAAPDFEAPKDRGGDNTYEVTAKVSDGRLSDSQALTIKVANVAGKALTGTGKADTLKGTGEEDTLKGMGRNDKLFGGAGADRLYGGDGKMGMGDDRFVFTKLSDSTADKKGQDTIFDFGKGDRFDLSAIDASAKARGDQAFSFIGTDKFDGKAGELRYEKGKSDTYVYADVNGDKKADFGFHLDDAVKLVKADFLL